MLINTVVKESPLFVVSNSYTSYRLLMQWVFIMTSVSPWESYLLYYGCLYVWRGQDISHLEDKRLDSTRWWLCYWKQTVCSNANDTVHIETNKLIVSKPIGNNFRQFNMFRICFYSKLGATSRNSLNSVMFMAVIEYVCNMGCLSQKINSVH
jgi:hypothetical protein